MIGPFRVESTQPNPFGMNYLASPERAAAPAASLDTERLYQTKEEAEYATADYALRYFTIEKPVSLQVN